VPAPTAAAAARGRWAPSTPRPWQTRPRQMAAQGEDGRGGGIRRGTLLRDARVPASVDLGRLVRAVASASSAPPPRAGPPPSAERHRDLLLPEAICSSRGPQVPIISSDEDLFFQNKPATSQQYSSLRTNQHQPSATSQPNMLLVRKFQPLCRMFQ
jgi:hypothetical protein